MKKRPAALWAFWANQNGPWHQRPYRVRWNEQLMSWWDSTGDGNVSVPGLAHNGTYLSFAAESKAEVELFMSGFNAARRIVAQFTAGVEEK